MSTTMSTTFAVIAYHGTQAGGGGSGASWPLFLFLGITATAVWLLFSQLRWRHTVMVAVAGWLVGFALTFAL